MLYLSYPHLYVRACLVSLPFMQPYDASTPVCLQITTSEQGNSSEYAAVSPPSNRGDT